MERVKWGIVGCGRIANKFCQDMPYVNNGSVVAVAARDKARALGFAKDHQVDKAYQGYGELFADPEIDIVYIATPHPQHFEHTRDALLAGQRVL